jgi:DNA (cytosine-5)-methyltransferase 1
LPKAPKETLADETDQLVNRILEQKIDGIIGGWPCQDISRAGQRKGIQRNAAGTATTRSGLIWEMVNTVCLVRPTQWLMENVAALFDFELGNVLKAVASIGYDAEWDCVSAGTVGAPHYRPRAYILANDGCNGGKGYFPRTVQRQPEFQSFENVRSIEEVVGVSGVSEPLLRRGNVRLAERLHAIGNGNPPCVIRELTKGLK